MKGIEYQMTIPYTSSQNGAVERAHRTIEERARCLLIGGRVLPSLWTEAVSCAVYLINRMPVPGRDGDIPYCLWFNAPVSEFSLNHLRVFGCAACATLPETLRDGKLAPAAIAGVHVGYDLGHKGYRICHPPSGKILFVRVKFDESVFPLANFSQTIDYDKFATSILKGAPAYPKTGAILPPPSHPTNGPDFTPGIDRTFTSTTASLPPSITPSSSDYPSVYDNMGVEQASSDVPLAPSTESETTQLQNLYQQVVSLQSRVSALLQQVSQSEADTTPQSLLETSVVQQSHGTTIPYSDPQLLTRGSTPTQPYPDSDESHDVNPLRLPAAKFVERRQVNSPLFLERISVPTEMSTIDGQNSRVFSEKNPHTGAVDYVPKEAAWLTHLFTWMGSSPLGTRLLVDNQPGYSHCTESCLS